ncbi:hypothetical protein GCM10023085_81780 [Actinomadura viridis]|uniref:Secreted protein n=1 Tax=Actinomadura viridis TaxID=58110 RepID=A0A931GLT7_9ACTN|nr:hypothetical protein [Actinomadura viridis]MBG6091385.1 hypothetical protein [Actinomadura viridis]
MRKTIRKTVLTGAVLAAGIGLAATPAMADDASWAVVNGGSVYAESVDTSLTVVRNSAKLTCDVVSANASIPTTSGHSGVGIGTISSTTWDTCRGPLSLTFTVAHSGSWKLNAIQPTSTAGRSVGTVTNVVANISGPGCTATFSGGVPAYYDNSTGQLTFDPTAPNPTGVSVVASGVSGCLGIITNGDVGRFAGTFDTDPNNVDLVYTP